MHVDHGYLDQVSGRTLKRRVNRIPLSKATHGHIAAIDVPKVAATTKDCFHIFVRTCFFNGPVHVAFYRRKFGKIGIDDLLCLTAWNRQALGQPKGRNPVNNAKISCFCLSTHVCSHLIQGHFENLSGSRGMNVTACFEGL